MGGITLSGGLPQDQFELVAVRANEGDPAFEFLAPGRGEGLDVAFGELVDGEQPEVLGGPGRVRAGAGPVPDPGAEPRPTAAAGTAPSSSTVPCSVER